MWFVTTLKGYGPRYGKPMNPIWHYHYFSLCNSTILSQIYGMLDGRVKKGAVMKMVMEVVFYIRIRIFFSISLPVRRTEMCVLECNNVLIELSVKQC